MKLFGKRKQIQLDPDPPRIRTSVFLDGQTITLKAFVGYAHGWVTVEVEDADVCTIHMSAENVNAFALKHGLVVRCVG